VKILPKVGPDGKDEIKFAMREIDIMRRVNHPNCIRMYGTYESSKHM
jgi:serine/threonine protein kinase